MSNPAEKIGIGVIALSAAISIFLWRVSVFTVLWSWFIVPFGLPEIGLGWAIGIGLTIGALRFPSFPEKTAEQKNKEMAFSVVGPVIALAIGWSLQAAGVTP